MLINMFSCICMLKQTKIHFFKKNTAQKIFVVEHSAFCQMKENYQIYLPYQFHQRPHSVGGDSQLSHKKMKTLFLSNMSKSRRLTSTFFPIKFNMILTFFGYLFWLKKSHCIMQMSYLYNSLVVFEQTRSGNDVPCTSAWGPYREQAYLLR